MFIFLTILILSAHSILRTFRKMSDVKPVDSGIITADAPASIPVVDSSRVPTFPASRKHILDFQCRYYPAGIMTRASHNKVQGTFGLHIRPDPPILMQGESRCSSASPTKRNTSPHSRGRQLLLAEDHHSYRSTSVFFSFGDLQTCSQFPAWNI